MTTLSQIIAIAKTKKAAGYKKFTDIHHAIQNTKLLTGISRTYRPLDEENGEQLPPEFTRVQLTVEQAISQVTVALTDMFDIIATQDWANCEARADIKVDGETIAKDVPVTYLLFLEKQMVDLLTFAKAIPVLDPAEQEWKLDPATGMHITVPYQSVKTKKIQTPLVKFAGDQYHPPQIDLVSSDPVVGNWTTVKYSGAADASRAADIIDRIEKLQIAIKFAREEANSRTVADQLVGSKILGYVFGKR